MEHYNELYHTGVMGMKWGKRKGGSIRKGIGKIGQKMIDANVRAEKKVLTNQEKKGPINKKYNTLDRLTDQQLYGTRGVQKISKRMDKGQSHTKASAIQTGHNIVKGLAEMTISFDIASGGALHKAGLNAVAKFMKSEMAKKAVVKIAQNSKYNPIDVAFKILD